MKTIKVKKWEEVPEDYTGVVDHVKGHKLWYLNGKTHRVDGPAVEYADGYKSWLLHGELHRVDGPAVERANGIKEWYLNGKLHRVDGPAIEHVNGDKEWWLNGKSFCLKEEWQKELDKSKPTCNGKTVEIDGKKYKLVLSEG